jgi:RNA polymerase sigma-70 factor (ECF subfamily)
MQNPSEDKELVLKLLQGGQVAEIAFQEFALRYGKVIYAQIFRMVRNQDQSKDVVQNVFMKIWTNLPSFREDSSLYTWVYRITRNETLNFLQKEKVRSTISLDAPIVTILPGTNHFEEISPEMISELLMKAIDSLPEKQALVFQLKYFEELKYSEISERIGTSEGALKANYHHAVQKIEEFLRNELNHLRS